MRESPRAKISPDKSNAQWPPKSPFQALLSSPSGRKKWQDRREQGRDRSLSPSPMKNSSRKLQDVSMQENDEEDDDEDDDEDMLRLKMEAIQAKLKLKALQKKRRLAAGEESSSRATSRAESGSLSASPRKTHISSASQPELRTARIEVEVSPTRARDIPQEPVSPARRRLGLSSATNATGISLKRPRDGAQVKRSDSVRSALDYGAPKTKSFSQRLQASRSEADERAAKFDRIERTRSTGFSHRETAFASTKQKLANESKASTQKAEQRDQVLSARGSAPSEPSTIYRSSSTRSSRQTPQVKPSAQGMFHTTGRSEHRPRNLPDSDSDLSVAPPSKGADKSPPSYDPFSEIHLSKRDVPHSVVAREMEGKEVYTLPRLLKEVKSPDYDPPECENDFVVFAILASKSSPYDQKSQHKTSETGKPQDDAEAPRNKFMVFHLTDLKWNVDCFLFGTAFDQFWKLTPGTLIAILNPNVLPPKGNQHSGRFALKLGSSDDCVMEIGLARDLGYCNAVKKDGQQCGDWIDKRSTEICEFHLNLFIEKQRKGRMEVNTMWRGTGNNPDHKAKSQARNQGGWTKEMNRRKGISVHREYGTLYAVPGGGSKVSAASLLDAEDTNQLSGWEAEEASRKRIAAAQKERDLQKRLGQMGTGVGAEYMQVISGSKGSERGNGREASERDAMFEKPSASDLGLLNNKANTAHLSPAKTRKHHFGLGAVSSTGRDAMGWGGARKAGLLQPAQPRLASPEKGQTRLDAIRPPAVRARSHEGSLSPKKRARFMLKDKGLREPGRESGGQDLNLLGGGSGGGAEEGYDDDELDIV